MVLRNSVMLLTENAVPRKMFPPVIIETVLSEIAKGRSLTAVLESSPAFPSKASWCRWITEDPDLSARYVRAVQLSVARRHEFK